MNLKGRNKVSPEFSMSSMTDIVFLLLVFFLLTSPSVTPEVLDLVLPKAEGKSAKSKDVSVSINKKMQYYINAKRVTQTGLEGLLIKSLQSNPDATIVLRVEQGVPIEKAVHVMDIANRNKFKIILAVSSK